MENNKIDFVLLWVDGNDENGGPKHRHFNAELHGPVINHHALHDHGGSAEYLDIYVQKEMNDAQRKLPEKASLGQGKGS